MAFGQVTKKPKAPTFYLKPDSQGGYAGLIGEDSVSYKTTQTGKIIVEINGGKDNGGVTAFGKPKTNQYGDFILFVIDGHFWYGKTMETKFGVTFQLKQGAKAEDSAEWKAKQAAGTTADGGVGPAGLAAPAGVSPGVQVKSVTEQFQTPPGVSAPTASAVKPPKPAGYKRPVQTTVIDVK